jgi:tRNA dimethylallyltransferase
LTGQPASEHYQRQPDLVERLDVVQVGIEWPRDVLYERINRRVDDMIECGFVEEVRRLIEGGFEKEVERLKTLGYRDVAAYLRGECALEEAVERIKLNTRRYAKRQLTWFRADRRIRWLSIERYPTIEAQADRALALLRAGDGAEDGAGPP